jgi:hypothetical protein
MITDTRLRTICLCVLLLPLSAAAIDVQDGRLSIDGFGSWAFGASSHDNRYSVAYPTGNFGSGDFALAITARLSERAVTGAQIRLVPRDSTIRLDWVFGEWRFSDRARLRLGIVKHPFGIYGEVPRVGTLRPFYRLPESVYGSTELTADGVKGISFSGDFQRIGSWSFSYDLYGGAVTVAATNIIDKVLTPEGLRPGGLLVSLTNEVKYIAGGRLIANTPVDGLDIRFSSYGTPVAGADAPRFVIGPSIQYVGEKLSAKAEYFFFYENGDHANDRSRANAAYLEVAYFVTEHIQLAALADFFEMRLFNGQTSSLFDHHELAAGCNYWFNPGLVVKLSVHEIDGNRFARPSPLDDALLAGSLDHHTTAVILGMQFSF